MLFLTRIGILDACQANDVIQMTPAASAVAYAQIFLIMHQSFLPFPSSASSHSRVLLLRIYNQ